MKFKKTPETEDVETEGLTGRHIFISYEWGSEAAALVVRKSLNRGGFATWLDTEKPGEIG